MSTCIAVFTAADAREPMRDFAVSATQLDVPAAPGSREPRLFAGDDGRVYLSWLEPSGKRRFALKFAVREGAGWSRPREIAEGKRWFVNWADFPSLIALADGTLVAHWLVKTEGGPYAYDIKMANSSDGGQTWSKPFSPHRDGALTQHGFVSLLPWAGNRVFVAWLDGSNDGQIDTQPRASISADMTLRYALLGKQGEVVRQALLDARVCTCCQTAAVRTGTGALVAYRDRTEQEIRDISVVRLRDGRWTEPQTVHEDGWKIAGCPVNGPALAVDGALVAIAWYTGAQGKPRVNVAFSFDGGDTFAAPIRVDDGNPLGRVDIELLAGGVAVVSWLEVPRRSEEIRMRLVRADGTRSESDTVVRETWGGGMGFPSITSSGADVYLAWTQGPRPTMVHSATFQTLTAD